MARKKKIMLGELTKKVFELDFLFPCHGDSHHGK